MKQKLELILKDFRQGKISTEMFSDVNRLISLADLKKNQSKLDEDYYNECLKLEKEIEKLYLQFKKKTIVEEDLGTVLVSRVADEASFVTKMFKPLAKLMLKDHAGQIGGSPNLTGAKPLGRVPNVGLKKNIHNNKKINRYLEYQEKRMYKHMSSGNYDAIVLIFLMLLKNSLCYQTLLYHRTKSD